MLTALSTSKWLCALVHKNNHEDKSLATLAINQFDAVNKNRTLAE